MNSPEGPVNELELCAKRSLAEFDLPSRGAKGPGAQKATMHALSRLETFWDDMKDRIQHQLE